jgi:hypothetical protein
MSLKGCLTVFPLALAAWALAAPSMAQAVTVPTPKETCFVAGQHPQITLAIAPADAVKAARIYFHSALGTTFYLVDMQRQGDRFVGVLPKPKLEAGPVTYYAEALDQGYAQFPTRQVDARVVQRADECDPDAVAPIAAPQSAPVVLGGAGGLPPGFTGMAGAAAVATPAAAGGGGLGSFLTSKTGLIIAGGVVVGGTTAAIILLQDDEKPASPSR